MCDRGRVRALGRRRAELVVERARLALHVVGLVLNRVHDVLDQSAIWRPSGDGVLELGGQHVDAEAASEVDVEVDLGR